MKKRILNKFTKQKIAILEDIANGLFSTEIAQKAGLSVSRIDAIVREMLDITGTFSRAHLISWAYKNGILKV